MSSSESTSAFEFSLTTTTITVNATNEGHSNGEFFASERPPNETSSSSIFSGATNLSLEYDTSVTSGYKFLIRDSFGCLQAKVDVIDSSIRLQNMNGTEILKITKRNEANELDVPRDVQAFEVCQQSGVIGTVKVSDKGGVRIHHNRANKQLGVLSLKVGDFAIFRSNSMSSPICNIHADVYSSEIVIGRITFHLETGITIEEQLLCTAAMIAFKTTMTQKMPIDDCAGKACGYCLLASAFIFVITVICFLAPAFGSGYKFPTRQN